MNDITTISAFWERQGYNFTCLNLSTLTLACVFKKDNKWVAVMVDGSPICDIEGYETEELARNAVKEFFEKTP